MIGVLVVFAAIGLIAAGLTGWLLAARALRSTAAARESSQGELEQRAAAAEARVTDLAYREEQRDAELGRAREAAATAREDLRAAQAALEAGRRATAAAEDAARTAQRGLAEATAAHAAQRAELATLQERLAAKESGQAREGRAVAEVQRVLAPLIERERMAAQLARLDVGRGSRVELPQLMDSIAQIGGFSTVVLSDEAGLPLAVNRGSSDGEMLAGLWSLLLTVADRIANSGAPVPVAVVVHDTANQTILHRLFSSAGSRFLLTAVSRGRSLEPEALDPALTKLERLLAGSALAS